MELEAQKAARQALILKYTKIVEACKGLANNTYWNDLREFLIEDLLKEVENRLQYEKDHLTIVRYQGEWGMVKKFADLQAVSDLYENEIAKLKKNAKG